MNNIPPSDEGEKEVRIQKNASRAKYFAFIAEILHALRNGVAIVSSIFAIILEALNDGIKGFSNFIRSIITIYLQRWLSHASKKLPDNQIGTSSDPSNDPPGDSPRLKLPPALSDARRQAENARRESEKIHISAVGETLVLAEKAALLAEDAAKRFANLDPSLPPQPSGVGRLAFKGSRLTYCGEIRNGEARGYGILQKDSVEIYRGEIVSNNRHGFGIDTTGQLTQYIGQFKDGRRHGVGQLRTTSYLYTGNFINNVATGHGVMVMHDSSSNWEKHEGAFVDGRAQGFGVRYFRNGQIHRGEFKFDEPNGFGIRELLNTIREAGYWERGACQPLVLRAQNMSQSTESV